MPKLKAMRETMAGMGAARWAASAAAAWAFLVVSTGAVLAAAPAGENGAEGAGLPQLNPETFAPQLVWLAITFAALYFLMAKVALPRVAEVLEERQERIADDLDRAEALKRDADSTTEIFENALASARTQAQSVMAQTVADINAAAAARNAQFDADLAAKTAAAEQRIDQAKAAAMANVRAVAIDAVQDITRKVAGVSVDAKAAERAVDDALGPPSGGAEQETPPLIKERA